MSQPENILANKSTPDKSLAAGFYGELPKRSVEFSGVGFISRKLARIVAVFFTLPIFVPGIYQYYYDETVLKRSEFDDLMMRTPNAAILSQFEKDLTQQSRFDSWVRHAFWKFRTGGIKPPGAMYISSDDFLFTGEEIKVYNSYSLTAPTPAPSAAIMPAILDFNAQLRQRGIRLVLLPIPLKVSIYPEKLAIDYRDSDGPAMPPGFMDWMAEVRRSGIDVIDLTPALWKAKTHATDPLYWKTDTHWSFAGRAVAADVIADYLRPLTAGLPRISFDVTTIPFDAEGDIAWAISRGWGNTRFPHIHEKTIKLTRDGKPFVGGDNAPILLAGDSFSVNYNNDGYGLGQELMLRLHTEVQVIGKPGDPINTARIILSQKPEAMAKKKIVIWEFAGRYMWRKWQKVTIK